MEKNEKLYFVLIFTMPHAQTLQVASRNSLCAARGRGKRIPENPENPVPFLLFFSYVPVSNPTQDELSITFFLEVAENVKNMF